MVFVFASGTMRGCRFCSMPSASRTRSATRKTFQAPQSIGWLHRYTRCAGRALIARQLAAECCEIFRKALIFPSPIFRHRTRNVDAQNRVANLVLLAPLVGYRQGFNQKHEALHPSCPDASQRPATRSSPIHDAGPLHLLGYSPRFLWFTAMDHLYVNDCWWRRRPG